MGAVPNHTKGIEDLLVAFKSISPSSRDEPLMRAAVTNMREDGFTEKEICRSLTGSLFDGLAWGNWPHVIHTPGKASAKRRK